MLSATTSYLPKACIAVILAFSFFSDTFFTSSLFRFGVMGVSFVVLLVYAARRDFRIFNTAPLVLWVLFYIYSLLNNNSNLLEGDGLQWIVCFGGILAIMTLLEGSEDESLCLFPFKCILAFAMFHAIVTVVCFLFPSAYESIVHPMFFSGVASVSRDGYKSGFTSHYSTNGIYLAVGLLSVLPFLLMGRRKKLYAACAVVILVALLLTTKRAHLVFGLCAFAVGYFLYNTKRMTSTFGRGVFVAVILVIGLLAASAYVPEITQVFDRISEALDDETFGNRSSFYVLCMDMWGDSPLIGNGMGSYTDTFNHTPLGAAYLASGYTNMKAHNVFLQVLAEGGLVGFILFLSASVGSLYLVGRTLVNANGVYPERTFARAVLAGSLAMQSFFLFYCLTGNPLYTFQSFASYLFCVGAGLTLVRQLASSRARHIGLGVKRGSFRVREGAYFD